MDILDFFKDINVSITISDTRGNVLYMNENRKAFSAICSGSVCYRVIIRIHKTSYIVLWKTGRLPSIA